MWEVVDMGTVTTQQKEEYCVMCVEKIFVKVGIGLL